jgi:peptide/nickel transport system substrate-binding protein
MKAFSIFCLAVVLCAALIITGCSQTTKTTTSSSAPTSAANTSTANTSTASTSTANTSTAPVSTSTTKPVLSATQTSVSTAAKSGGTLRLVASWSPGTATGWPPEIFGNESTTMQFGMEALLVGDANGNMKPWLAESFKVADDLMSINFTLRKDVKFHDGTPLNAQAAKWNLDQIIKAGKEQYWKSVDIIDEFSFRVNFNKWTNTNLQDFGGGYAWMVSPTAFEKHGVDWMRDNPTGTGPFKFKSFQKDVSYSWVKNPDYWIKGRPYLDAVEVLYVTDAMTQKSVLQSGGAELLQLEPGKTAHDLQAAGYDYFSQIITIYSFLPDNGHADSPYANPKVMEAIDYAIDRDAIAKAFSYGYWTATYQVPPSSCAAYNPNFNLIPKMDVTKAKALLAEAGYPNGFKTTILNNSSVPREYSQYLQASLAAINIQAVLSYPETVGAFIEATNSMNNVLVIQPLMATPNYNTSIILFLLGKDSLWDHNFKPSSEFLKLREASLFAPKYDGNLVRAATDQLSKEHAVIPFAAAGMGWSIQKYVKNGGFGTRSSTDLFDSINMWLDK